MVVVASGGKSFYMDDWLNKKLDAGQDIVRKKDEDLVIAVDGEEGSGKSVFSMQLAKRLDPSFCVERVAMNAQQFRDCIMKANKCQAIVFDEAFSGLSSRGALSEINKLLVELMMEMRQKNLFIIIVMPTFFLLDRYVALWRARALFHVYRHKGKRGYWIFFGKTEKKLLYLYGKKDYAYVGRNIPTSRRRGRFLNQYVIDEVVYRGKKRDSFQSKERVSKVELLMFQRDRLFLVLHEEFGLSVRKIVELLKRYRLSIGVSTVGDLLLKTKKSLDDENTIYGDDYVSDE